MKLWFEAFLDKVRAYFLFLCASLVYFLLTIIAILFVTSSINIIFQEIDREVLKIITLIISITMMLFSVLFFILKCRKIYSFISERFIRDRNNAGIH
jgi:hypothetical protein